MAGSIVFRVLGPLDALVDGRSVAIGRGKQRALLALLLVNANQVVSRDRLIDDLWGERPPETAPTALQVYVSRLRKVLPRDMLRTQAPGYVLDVAPDQLDARIFESLVGQGRDEAAAGQPAQAAELLRDGLALWRGPPLADVAYEPFAQAEIARLEELRLIATELQIDAELALGRHAELVAKLEALVAVHPLRERLRGQLMLALYRSGRQAEALDEYRRARHALVDELGIEPSRELQELEQAILRQDEALSAPPLSAPEAPPAVAAPARKWPAERKLVTILFADLGVDADPEADPEELSDLLDRVFAAAADELEAAGGTVERGVADAILAVFGAPRAQEDHAERALVAALALRDRLASAGGAAPALRIAVETGEILLARDGSPATGPPVSVAGRLLRNAQPGQILVGDRAAAAVAGVFELSGDPPEVVRRVAESRARGVRGLGPAFVGRRDDLALLVSTYERVVRERAPRLVTVVGEPGVGKTTLVRRFQQELEGDPGRWYAGRCLAYGRGITYRPLAGILRELIDVGETDPADTLLQRLHGRRILGLTLGLDVAPGLHPRETRDQLHDAWTELLTDAAAESPLVLLVEDAHWAEEPLLELLERLARRVPGPLLVVVTSRPELVDRAPGWGRGATRVWLEPLSQADTVQMLSELAGDLPEAVSRAVIARAEGNPFFVEELLQALVDRGVLVRANGGWHAGDLPRDLAVPDSLNAVLAARIDLLPTSEKSAIQAAAVIGRAFWENPMRELLAGVDADLDLLEERDLVRRRAGSSLAGEREYVFKHALTREVAYSLLPAARRARLHAGFAEWLERRGSADEDAGLLAHHYAESVGSGAAGTPWRNEPARADELATKAVAWLRRAAELATLRYDLTDAIALLDQALAIETDTRVRIEILRAAGTMHMLGYDTESFRRRLEEALALEPDRDTSAEIYAALAHYGRGRPYMWKEAPPEQLGDEWLTRALELAKPKSVARASALVASALARPESGTKAAAEAVEIAESAGHAELLAHACEARALVETAAGRHREACRWSDRALEAARDWPDPDLKAHQYWNAGFSYLRAGRLGPVRGFAEEFDRIASRLTPHHEVHAVALHALVESTFGRWDRLAELAARAEDATAANETPCQFNWRSLIVCALGLAHSGDERESRRLEEAARTNAVPAGPAEREPALLRLALLRGDVDELERALDAMPEAVDPFGLDLAAARLDALVALGALERAEAEAAPHLEREGYTRPFALRALGTVRRSRELLQEAAATFESMGLDWRATETRAAALALGSRR
jgi:DNA-binding SARP family transcriptional activator